MPTKKFEEVLSGDSMAIFKSTPGEKGKRSFALQRAHLVKWSMLAVLIIAFAVVAQADARGMVEEVLRRVAALGPLGPVLFIVAYILATVLFVPGSLLTLGAGAVFGVVWGSVYVSIASTVGACIAFVLAKTVLRGFIERKLEEFPDFAAVDGAVGREGWKIVFLTRLSPLFPFNLLNYAFGLTRVSLRAFALASWIGMMPGTVLYVYVGAVAGDIARLTVAGGQRSVFEWSLYVVGLLATVIVTVYVTRIARLSLRSRLD